MTTERNFIAVENTTNYFRWAKKLNNKITDLLKEFNDVDDDEKHVVLDEIKITLKDLIKYTYKVNVTIITREYGVEQGRKAHEYLEGYKRNILNVEKFLIGKSFLDASMFTLELYIEKLKINRYEYMRYAKDEKELAYKVGQILTDIKYIETFRPLLPKIASGKMGLDEFKKLFDSIRGKLPFVKGLDESFTSFSNFKKIITNV